MDTFAPPTRLKMNAGGYGVAEFGDDSSLFVLFYKKSVPNVLKSRNAGREIYEDQEYVKIAPPGERLNVVDRPVRDEDRQRFPMQYARFLHNKTQVPDGTPVELLFPNSPSIADNLKALGVYTVEQLSELSAHALDNIGMGAQDYQNKAKRYLDSSRKGKGFHEMQKKFDDSQQQVHSLQQQIQMQKAQIDDLYRKMASPQNYQQQPPFIPGHDAQSERLNANHVTAELAKTTRRPAKGKTTAAPPVEELEHQHLAEEASENDAFSTEGI